MAVPFYGDAQIIKKTHKDSAQHELLWKRKINLVITKLPSIYISTCWGAGYAFAEARAIERRMAILSSPAPTYKC